jgi:hypothetical protein
LAGTLLREGLRAHVREVMEQLVVEYIGGGLLPGDDPASTTQPFATGIRRTAPRRADHRRSHDA